MGRRRRHLARPEVPRSRIRDPREDEPARDGDVGEHRAPRVRPHPQSVESRLLPRRFERWLRRRGRRRAWSPSRTATTWAAPSASPRARAGWSGSSQRAHGTRSGPTSASTGASPPTSTCSRAACATPPRSSTPRQVRPSAIRTRRRHPRGRFLPKSAPTPAGCALDCRTRRRTSDDESHPDCLAAVEETARVLESLGHHVEPADVPALDHPSLTEAIASIFSVFVALRPRSLERRVGPRDRPIGTRPLERGHGGDRTHRQRRAVSRGARSCQYVLARPRAVVGRRLGHPRHSAARRSAAPLGGRVAHPDVRDRVRDDQRDGVLHLPVQHDRAAGNLAPVALERRRGSRSACSSPPRSAATTYCCAWPHNWRPRCRGPTVTPRSRRRHAAVA